MSDSAVVKTTTSPVTAVPAAEKRVKKVNAAASTKAKKPSATASHPTSQVMVDAAIKTLRERGGSSIQAIKKYLTSTYKVDAQKLAPFIRKYLVSAVSSGKLIQTKGKGASGSFKLSTAASKDPKPTKAAVEKKKSSAAVTKKAATVKKVTVVVKKTAEKANAKSVKKTGTVKEKSVRTKAPATKPKVPKAKTTVAAKQKKYVPVKKPAAKKAAAKK